MEHRNSQNNNIGNVKSAALLIAFLLFSGGCEKSKFLDTKPMDAITQDLVFTDPALARASLLTIYGAIPRVFGRSGGIPFDMNTRDATHSFPWMIANNLRYNNYHAATSETGLLQSMWSNNYSSIRMANTFIQGIESSSFSDAAKKTFLAEGRFLRAVFYLELYRFFGGVPVITVPQDVNGGEALFVKRNTTAETNSFIVKEFTDASVDLPVTWSGNDRGRAEKGAALGMLARALMYEAGLNNDAALFKQAAAAAKAVIDLKRYSLYSNYQKMFFAKSDNNEFIFYYNYTTQTPGGWQTGGWSLLNAPLSDGAWGGAMPSQNFIDEFEMTDGKLYNESPLYNPNMPYANRDPRFEASIYHQGSSFKGVPFEFFVGGKDYIINGYTTTGFYIRKGIDETIPDYYFNNGACINQYDPLLRYADVLLMYAEAENELGAPETARVYVNYIRSREGVNMPEIPAGLTVEQMRKKIRHERHIELNFEESRFHDIRRWRIAEEVSAGPIYGVKITKNTNGTLTYDKQTLYTRPFDPKYKLLPIPQSEINKNSNLTQNPGY